MMGKIIGAIVGWLLLRSPAGLFIGFVVGHLYDQGRRQRSRVPRFDNDFISALFTFAGALSKSDGRVSEPEIAATEALMARLALDPQARRFAIERFNAGKQLDSDVGHAVAALRSWTGGRRDFGFMVLDLLLDVLFAEGALVPAKKRLLLRLCAALNIAPHEVGAVAAMKGHARAWAQAGGEPGWRSSPGARAGPGARRPPPPRASEMNPYDVLGVERSMPEREVKRAYRKLMSQHHPDKLGSDVPETVRRRAEERARQINAAWERIQSERGWR